MIFAEIGKFIGAKIAGVLITLSVLAGGYWCYRNWDQVTAFGHVVKLTLFWLVLAAALPWSSFVFMRPLLNFQSSLQDAKATAAVSIALIAGYWIVDIVLALWLSDWSIHGGFTWFVVLLGFLAAGAYNYIICESLARYADQ